MAEGTHSVLAGLIGAGIQGSLSPALHEHEAERHGLRLVYRLIDIDELGLGPDRTPDLLAEALRMGYSGLNITHPCKQAVLDHLDELSPEAAAIGAVNTVVFDGVRGSGGMRAIGHNTDWAGFARGLEHGLPGAGLGDVVLVGAGGAGAAVAYALLNLGAERLTVVDVEPRRAELLARKMDGRFGGSRVHAGLTSDLAALISRADGVVNATPIGMAAHPGVPFSPRLLRSGQWVTDLIYAPAETRLLHEAAKLGCRTINGGGMLVHQAAEAFRHFTGIRADAERMLAHFLSRTARPRALSLSADGHR
ncbi:shikimate dehydrogenase [Spongiactinospora sp. 9N601]|uniref:shikimate dehydrogenase n=1 Tax=Spongiactinospora sp. 9N601 TaxID=3375149 RepID=UPI0037B66095